MEYFTVIVQHIYRLLGNLYPMRLHYQVNPNQMLHVVANVMLLKEFRVKQNV